MRRGARERIVAGLEYCALVRLERALVDGRRRGRGGALPRQRRKLYAGRRVEEHEFCARVAHELSVRVKLGRRQRLPHRGHCAEGEQTRLGADAACRRLTRKFHLQMDGGQPRARRDTQPRGGGKRRVGEYRQRRDIDFTAGIAAMRAAGDRYVRALAADLPPFDVQKIAGEMQPCDAIAGDSAQQSGADAVRIGVCSGRCGALHRG
jgi:hypothetical protein